jgi:hypothetical protein
MSMYEAYPVDPTDRPPSRRFAGQILVAVAVAMAAGVATRAPSHLEVNDISRWCTVWSLLERGTYAIDECPWQARTQDKVKKPDRLAAPGADAGALKRLEWAIAPASWKAGEASERFYSSKPPLLPTMIAGVLYPFRLATGVELDRTTPQARIPRYVEKAVEGGSGKTERVLETPKDPVQWPVYVFYLKPIVLLLNLVPFLALLIVYAWRLDRDATDDWGWMFCLAAAGFGTYLFAFDQTLNNHTVAAWSAFFALYHFLRIWEDGETSPRRFALCGLFGAFCACNELPAALFGLVLFATLLIAHPRRTLAAFVPAAAVPCAAFLVTQYLAFGQFKPVYEEFGTKSYEFEGSYWTTPLEMDWFNRHPESYPRYLFHMTFGHHGVFSLTPVFLFSIYGAWRLMRRGGRPAVLGWMTAVLTLAMVAFYTWNPKARNYGGSTQGLRWLFWLIPFWLLTLPAGVRAGGQSRAVRTWALAALAVSTFSVGYALRHPWSHPWMLDLLEHVNLYALQR